VDHCLFVLQEFYRLGEPHLLFVVLNDKISGSSSKMQYNNGMVSDPKSGTFECVSACVGFSVLVVWHGARW